MASNVLNRLVLAAALAMSGAPAMAQGEGPAASDPANSGLVWLRRPTGAEFARHYPDRAGRLGRSGEAVIRCMTTSQGTLVGCVVLAESPAGAGFGRAALQLARYFQVGPAPGKVGDVGGQSVSIPIRFNMGH